MDGIGPFTGMHDGLIDEYPELGDIMVDYEILEKESISSSVARFKISTLPCQRGAIGVCSQVFESPPPGWRPEDVSSMTVGGVLNPVVPAGMRVVHVNALGEGQINVCAEGGNLAAGDLIVTSSLPGKGMRQSDDLIRNTTVAKCREAVTFSSPAEVRQVACIYLCG